MDTPINMQDFASKIAAALGPTWTVAPNQEAHQTFIRHVSDPEYVLQLRSGTHEHPTQLRIRGHIPYSQKCRGNGLNYGESVAHIGVAPTKSPEQIAKDITRRLLLIYAEQYFRAKAAVVRDETETSQKEALEQTVKEMTHSRPVVVRYCTSTKAYIELSVTPAQLAAILALLS